MLSTIAQVTGAVSNIVLDYIFIYPLKMGVAGAAWATVAGQFISMFIAMAFHYTKNREIDGKHERSVKTKERIRRSNTHLMEISRGTNGGREVFEVIREENV